MPKRTRISATDQRLTKIRMTSRSSRVMSFGHWFFVYVCILLLYLPLPQIQAARPSSWERFQQFLPGRKGFPIDDDDDEDDGFSVQGQGRQLDLFESSRTNNNRNALRITNEDSPQSSKSYDVDDDDDDFSIIPRRNRNSDKHIQASDRPAGIRYDFPPSSSASQQASSSSRRSSSPPHSSSSSSSRSYYYNRRNRNKSSQQKQQPHHFSILQPVHDWFDTYISPNIKNWPKLQCRVEPTTTLKLRKTFRPLKTVIRLGADFNTQLGVWQFKSSWEDAIIGSRLTLIAGRELQLTKSWQLSVGGNDDLVTRLRLRAAVDLQTWKAYARVGFRTERLSPINVMEGFTLLKRLPLDGHNGHIKLEVKANLALPEPELEYSTETQRSLIGMGDIQVNIEELNLVLDY